MEEAWLGAVLLVLAALAGCIGGEEGSLESTDAPTDVGTNASTDGPTLPDGRPAPGNLTLAGCNEHGGAFPVPAGPFQEELPEGFSPVPFGPEGPTATLVVIAVSCSTSEGAPVAELTGFLQVEPSEDLSAGDVPHLVVLGGFSTSEQRVDVYDAWGMGDGIDVGDVTLEEPGQAPVARAGHAQGSGDGFTVDMVSTVEGPPEAESAGEARIFGVADGSVTGVVDLNWTDSQGGFAQGEATLTFQGDVSVMAGIPQPPTAGLAWHWWGDDYDIRLEHVPIGPS